MSEVKFKFISDAIGGDLFTVVGFKGQEAISTLYHYDIELKAALSADIDLDDVLDATARFVIEQDGNEYPVNGVLSSFEEFNTVLGYCYYRAVLVPKIWKLTNYRTNEIFYQAGDDSGDNNGLTVDLIIAQVLEKAGIGGDEYDLTGLSGNLLQREYRCQYNESDFDLISRLMENEGIFYYFEQGESAEKIVFINDQNYLSIPREKLLFDVASQTRNRHDAVHALSCRKQRLPLNVIVRDYNPEEPSLDVSDITDIDSMGQGTEYIYGKNVHSDTEATYLSQIRAEEYICRKTQYFGESSVPRLQSGYLFSLDGHPNPKHNGIEYLAVEVNHEGQHLDAQLSSGSARDVKPQYENSFVAIPGEVQYRPPRKTRKPKITGTLHARIDGEQDSEYAQLDSEGRYKVSMPFDFHNEEHPEGLASARVRMMQPYAGKKRGMQFPMAKGTEVLLSFIDGDPDRPIIAGAINTAAAPGPVTADNQTESVIQTGGNNKIRMEDKAGEERIVLESPASNSWIRVGAKNDPPTLNGASAVQLEVNSTAWSDPGAKQKNADNTFTDIFAADSDITLNGVVTAWDSSQAGDWNFIYRTSTGETANRTVTVYTNLDEWVDDPALDSDGIRIHTAGNLWMDAKNRYAEYVEGTPAVDSLSRKTGAALPNEIGDLRDFFDNSYIPTGMLDRTDKREQPSFRKNVLANAQVKLSSLDTVTTQEGNIYDFGGYWNYNLGNSYAEDHLNQSAALNADHDYDLLDVGGPNFTGWSAVSNGTAHKRIARVEEIEAHPDSKDWTNIWVEKKFGDSYEYTEGSTISVTKGGSQDVEIGGVHVEESYRGNGTRKSWSIRGVSGKPSEEKKWNGKGTLVYHSTSIVTDESVTETEMKFDRGNGAMYSYSGSSGTGMTYSGFDFNFSNGAKASIDAGFRSESGLYLLGKNTNSVFIGLKMDIDLALAGALKIENDGITFSAPGFTAKTKTTVVDTKGNELKTKLNMIDSTLTVLGTQVFKLNNTGAAQITNTGGVNIIN